MTRGAPAGGTRIVIVVLVVTACVTAIVVGFVNRQPPAVEAADGLARRLNVLQRKTVPPDPGCRGPAAVLLVDVQGQYDEASGQRFKSALEAEGFRLVKQPTLARDADFRRGDLALTLVPYQLYKQFANDPSAAEFPSLVPLDDSAANSAATALVVRLADCPPDRVVKPGSQ